MEEFDPMRVNSYTVEQLADMISNGNVTLEDIYASGLRATRRPELEAELQRRRNVVIEDDEAWEVALRKNTVPGYESYLRRYDKYPPEYRGKHVAEAKAAIDELYVIIVALRQELFETMMSRPWSFNHESMKALFKGESDPERLEALRGMDDIQSRFLASGQKITYKDLIDNKIISKNISMEALVSPEQNLIQTNAENLRPFPTERRTEIYFIGVPRGGKSSVLAGVLSNMYRRGVAMYEPHFNRKDIDLVRRYYNGLIESTEAAKFPVSTNEDSVSFMKFTLNVGRKSNQLTFVELGGEAFRRAAEGGRRGRDAWENVGAADLLNSNNKKMLVFILDYGINQGVNDRCRSETEQAQILETMLTAVLDRDGTGMENRRGCTLSKTDSVAVVVTKSDLMGEDDHERRDKLAMEYVKNRFSNFMNTLTEKCREYGINSRVGYAPYVMAFSLGKLFVGNTYEYDPTDSRKIVDFISQVTDGDNETWLGRLFG